MSITTLIDRTAENTALSKAQTEAAVKAALEIIRGAIARGKRVQLNDFGTFEARRLSDRNEGNPQAGDPINCVRVIRFLPAEALRKEVNNRL